MDLVQIADFVRSLAAVVGTIVIAYAGFVLATSRNPVERAEWKEIIGGAVIGLVLIFLAP
ncbi:MAG: hypothetical protein HZA83_01205, partial [Thaumarchaeota archaeon]|nr:hypothetical protein [Nitrososphaerota archaeon]